MSVRSSACCPPPVGPYVTSPTVRRHSVRKESSSVRSSARPLVGLFAHPSTYRPVGTSVRVFPPLSVCLCISPTPTLSVGRPFRRSVRSSLCFSARLFACPFTCPFVCPARGVAQKPVGRCRILLELLDTAAKCTSWMTVLEPFHGTLNIF